MSVADDVVQFLRDPEAFAQGARDGDLWLRGLDDFALPSIESSGDRRLRPAQEAAWRGLAERRTGLILGPPGTGKTHLLSWLIAGFGQARSAGGRPARTFVTAFTKNAIGNVLDSVAVRQTMHEPAAPRPVYFGAPPAAGLGPGVDLLAADEGPALLAALDSGRAVVGATIWSLYRLLRSGMAAGADGPTAPLFDLVCLDEASQMVLGHGLMALGGLAPDGRVVVSGDDQQLPPVRGARQLIVGGREVGGSLYAFLKSANASEFALEETFRLNAPLARFPERKFYPGRYRSAVPAARLALQEGWEHGLDAVARAALDPALPLVILVHDGPAAATSNPFEAVLAARLAAALAERARGEDGGPVAADIFWREIAAVVSPHRAQNALIRRHLPDSLRSGAFVETVDRIQGKERDFVILSYCVADPEFALAEAEFIFSSERLNVAATRGRSKLVMILSRKLLEAVPADQEVMDRAEILREFVFSAEEMGERELDGPHGRIVRVQIRARGFEDALGAVRLAEEPQPAPVQPGAEMTPALQGLLDTIRAVAAANRYASAPLFEVRTRMALEHEPFEDARTLHRLGWVSLQSRRRNNARGSFWVATAFDQPRRVYGVDLETVRARLSLVVREARSRRFAFYETVRDRFNWIGEDESDRFEPVLRQLAEEGLVRIKVLPKGSRVVELAEDLEEAEQAEEAPVAEVTNGDFELLNGLEDLERGRINFGVVETWTSSVELARRSARDPDEAAASLARLEAAGYLMLAADGRVRSRMAELARELRHVKQRFRTDDAGARPYLVRSLKIEVKERSKPDRNLPLLDVFQRAAAEATQAQARVLRAMGGVLWERWGRERACFAQFQEDGLRLGLAAWRGEGSPTIAVAADTGSGKTEAAVLPLIAGALGDRLEGIEGTRAVLAYPRIRLVANQAQRLAGYLAAFGRADGLPLLTLGLQVKDVPDRFAGMHERYSRLWSQAGENCWVFPFFACPECARGLLLRAGEGEAAADALICDGCGWRYDGWIGSKAGLAERPPSLFLPTTDSLHQWLHDWRYGKLFGDSLPFAPPRALLADEIHLYTHIHGAQVGLALRRLAGRCEANAGDGRKTVAIGMSATIGDPAAAWGRLMGRNDVAVVRPEAENAPNPRGREYFYFIQPEVESRGADIAGASTTIQSLMCLAHGMRRRTGVDGGFRSLVFFDSIDKMRRLHGAFVDAEEQRRLAGLRVADYGEDALGHPQTECCRDPVGCDRFRDGECWWFAANDARQRSAKGRRPPAAPLSVADRPIYSGTGGNPEALLKGTDIVFATSSLEVGYDDPDITLVYQHYAPQNLASFIQRKGRGGRGLDDRPLTAVTLSIYSPGDTWWFRRPEAMISPVSFEIPINPDNFFVRRGQILSALLDGLARFSWQDDACLDARGQPLPAALAAAAEFAEGLFGAEVWNEFGCADAPAFWAAAAAEGGAWRPVRYLNQLRDNLPWAPGLLFETINLPVLEVAGLDVEGGDRQDVGLAFTTLAPGNATRRYNAHVVHWRPPTQGHAPWFAAGDYRHALAVRLRADSNAILAELPVDERSGLSDVHPDLCRPIRATLSRLGEMSGATWTGEVACVPGRDPPFSRQATDSDAVRHDSRGELRGFILVSVDSEIPVVDLSDRTGAPFARSVRAHISCGSGSGGSGLKMARVYWGADAEVRYGEPVESTSFTQIFTSPRTGRVLLHGYEVETEGLRIEVDSDQLDSFVAEVQAEMAGNSREARWRAAQFTRYVVESRARGAGLNGYEARRGADLLVAAAGDPELRARLNHLLGFWSEEDLRSLLEDTRIRLLHQHPLMTPARVGRTATALAGQSFQSLIAGAIAEVQRPEAMAAYLRSCVLHGLLLRLREWVSHVGHGDDRRLLAHARLPIQFGEEVDDVITLSEAGSHGDGTIRGVVAEWGRAVALWDEGFLATCPNAEEDAVVRRFWTMRDRHEAWRALDARDPATLARIALEIDPGWGTRPLPTSLVRILFEMETVEAETFQRYDIALAFEDVRLAAEASAGRDVVDWELATAAVTAATEGRAPVLERLYQAYAAVESTGEGSLSAEGRLAEQAFRLAAPLCLDGCRGCVHQGSDLMSDSLVEASVSRRLLQGFLRRGAGS